MFRYTDLFKPEAIAIYFVIAATFVYAVCKFIPVDNPYEVSVLLPLHEAGHLCCQAIPEETEEEQGDQDAPHGLGSQKKAVATEHKVPILRRRSQEIMQSKLGPVQITFYGEKSSVPRILTLHDIGTGSPRLPKFVFLQFMGQRRIIASVSQAFGAPFRKCSPSLAHLC